MSDATFQATITRADGSQLASDGTDASHDEANRAVVAACGEGATAEGDGVGDWTVTLPDAPEETDAWQDEDAEDDAFAEFLYSDHEYTGGGYTVYVPGL